MQCSDDVQHILLSISLCQGGEGLDPQDFSSSLCEENMCDWNLMCVFNTFQSQSCFFFYCTITATSLTVMKIITAFSVDPITILYLHGNMEKLVLFVLLSASSRILSTLQETFRGTWWFRLRWMFFLLITFLKRLLKKELLWTNDQLT